MSLSRDEANQFLLALLPPGSEQFYDLSRVAGIGKFFYALSGAIKTYGTDIIDTLRREVSPLTIVDNIPVWEEALGLNNTPIAKFGTEAQRRNAVIAWLRQSGSFSLADIRAIVQPYLLYANPSNIQILETNRTNLFTAHDYVGAAFGAITPNATNTRTVTILDDPRVSAGTVRIHFRMSSTADQITPFIIGPDGMVAFWQAPYLGEGVTGLTDYYLNTPVFAGRPIKGVWTFGVATGPGATVISNWDLFVEGIGVNYQRNVAGDLVYNGEGLGAAIFEMGVVADLSLLGTGYDINGAIRALQRWKPAHVRATVVYKVDGTICATPDTFTAMPGRAIPCS